MSGNDNTITPELFSSFLSRDDTTVQKYRETLTTVVNDAFPTAVAERFLNDMHTAEEFGLLTPNKVALKISSTESIELVKPCIYECDVHEAAVREKLPAFRELCNCITEVIQVLSERLQLPLAINQQDPMKTLTLKLQKNAGGAFPWHYDNPGPPNKRILTLAVYLTKNWTDGDGGEIGLMPFLRDTIVVPPVFNRVALFSSDAVLHRVYPRKPQAQVANNAARYCFTIWFDADDTKVNQQDNALLREKHLNEDFVPHLMMSPLQRSLSRLLYHDEYLQSLKDCFGDGTRDFVVSKKLHEAHVLQLMQNPKVVEFVRILKSKKK